MGNDFIDVFSDMDKCHLKQSVLNKFTRTRNKTVYNKHNEKAKPKNLISNRKNGLKENGHNCFENLFNSKIQNGLKISNGVSKLKTMQCKSEVVIISSDDSLPMEEFEKKVEKNYTGTCKIQYSKNSETYNGKNHINYKIFKKKKVIVRIKRSHKIENLLKNKSAVSLNAINKQTKELNIIKCNSSKNKKANNCIELSEKISQNKLDILSSNKCNYVKKQKSGNKKCEENRRDSVRTRSLINNRCLDTKACALDKSLKNFPLFETIFIDTINIDDSETSSSLHTSPNKDVGDLKLEKQHQMDIKNEKNFRNIPIRKNKVRKKSKTRLKNLKKIDERDINLKNCKINVKNLSLAQIKQKIIESRYRANRRRRSWSVSDVAREHDRRLNFFPEAGPSHIDYYALIKLPVVKPKVPIG